MARNGSEWSDDFAFRSGDPAPFLAFALKQLFLRVSADLAHVCLLDDKGEAANLALDQESLEVPPERLMPDVVAQVIRESKLLHGKVTGEARDLLSVRSLCAFACVPFTTTGGIRGAILVAHATDPDAFFSITFNRLTRFAAQFVAGLERVLAAGVGTESPGSVAAPTDEAVGESSGWRLALARADRFAGEDFPVLISGPSGCGKELIANRIHNRSARRRRPIEVISMAAIAESLLQSELHGHVKGAYTGAIQDRDGRLEAADGGTVVLDDIAFAPPTVLTALLRFLARGEVVRTGSNSTTRLDVRVIATTSVPLSRMMQAGQILKDFYFRLKQGVIRIPPLASRRVDIPILVECFQRRHSAWFAFEPAAWRILLDHSWPGDVRELENLIKVLASRRKAVVTAADVLEDLEDDEFERLDSILSLDEHVAAATRAFLNHAWLAAGQSWKRAAEILKKPYSTVYGLARKHGLLGDEPRSEISNLPPVDSKSKRLPE